MKYGDLIPKECPSEVMIGLAISILEDQQLSIYQTLLKEGLTAPNKGGQFRVERLPGQLGGASSWLTITNNSQPYSFTTKSPDGVVSKCCRIVEAITGGLKKFDSRACCPLAVKQNCVCDLSFKCEIHGTKCIGSHD